MSHPAENGTPVLMPQGCPGVPLVCEEGLHNLLIAACDVQRAQLLLEGTQSSLVDAARELVEVYDAAMAREQEAGA